MPKEKIASRVDQGILALPISLPSSAGESLIDLNPDIVEWAIVSPYSGEVVPVFPGIQMGNNQQLAHYVILFSWFNSNTRGIRDLKSRKEKSLAGAYINYKDLPKKSSPNGFSVADVDFVKGSLGDVYLRNFCFFQQHEPYHAILRTLRIMQNLDDFYEGLDIESTIRSAEETDVAILKEMREYMKAKLEVINQISSLHKVMLAKKYTIEELLSSMNIEDFSPVMAKDLEFKNSPRMDSMASLADEDNIQEAEV